MNTEELRELERSERIRVAGLVNQGAVFVFGSNTSGRHGKGAAFYATAWCDARRGQGEGVQGRSYAIPTKDRFFNTRPLPEIAASVQRFLRYAESKPLLTFAVTRIGCGLAGYDDADISPMFADAPQNCLLPTGWRLEE